MKAAIGGRKFRWPHRRRGKHAEEKDSKETDAEAQEAAEQENLRPLL
jgi:hypothetical protein